MFLCEAVLAALDSVTKRISHFDLNSVACPSSNLWMKISSLDPVVAPASEDGVGVAVVGDPRPNHRRTNVPQPQGTGSQLSVRLHHQLARDTIPEDEVQGVVLLLVAGTLEGGLQCKPVVLEALVGGCPKKRREKVCSLQPGKQCIVKACKFLCCYAYLYVFYST